MTPEDRQRQMTVHLLQRAIHLAGQTIDAATGQRTAEEIYTSAGGAIEAAIKSRLCAVSPFLLAPDGRDWFRQGAELYLPGAALSGAVKTVAASEAALRLDRLDKNFREVRKHVSEIQSLRNEAVHFGFTEKHHEETITARLAIFCVSMNVILSHTDEATIWGERKGYVDELLADRGHEVTALVQRRMLRAKDIFSQLDYDRVSHLSHTARELIEDESHNIDLVIVECPACGYDGMGFGDTDDFGDAEGEYDDGELVLRWMPDIQTTLFNFKCHVCGLELVSVDEIVASGLPKRVENTRVSPGDLEVERSNYFDERDYFR